MTEFVESTDNKKIPVQHFMGEQAILREDQLFEIYKYIFDKPSSERVDLAVMFSPPGSGKTKMLFALPRQTNAIRKKRDDFIQDINLLLKSDPNSEKIQSTAIMINKMPSIKEYVDSNVVFLPITFNGGSEWSDLDENLSMIKAILSVVARMIFSHFTFGVPFNQFFLFFLDVFRSMSLLDAVQVIRHDCILEGGEEEEKTFRKPQDCRLLLSVDELVKVQPSSRRDHIFSSIKNELLIFSGQESLSNRLYSTLLFFSFSLCCFNPSLMIIFLTCQHILL